MRWKFSPFLIIFWRYTVIKDLLINEEITAKEVRLIGSDGTPLGIVSLNEALRQAEEQELDLVLIAETANPPVCKIINYGKYKFETLKKEKEAKKRQKIVELKEMQLSLRIEENDFNIKARKVREFLEDGNKVKVALRLRGREMANPQAGMPVMEKFFEKVQDVSTQTSKPALNGRQIIMVLAPKSEK